MKESNAHKHHTNIKDIDNRLATIEGHIKGIRQMIADGKECEDVLLQLHAIGGALKKVSKKIINDHLNSCVKESIENGDAETLKSFAAILEKYI